jgi:hypothetical protein
MSVRREVADGLASRMSAAILTSSGSAADAGHKVGSVQDDEFEKHQHQYTLFPGGQGGIASGDYWTTNDNGQTGPSGGNETRPRNVYVDWIIRAK